MQAVVAELVAGARVRVEPPGIVSVRPDGARRTIAVRRVEHARMILSRAIVARSAR